MLTSRFIQVFLPRGVPTSRISGLMLAVCFLALLTPLSLLIDVPVARFCLAGNMPGDLQRVLNWSELVAHGLGIAIIAGMLCVLDPIRRRFLPRLLAGALGAGLCADAFKLITARIRPRHLELDAGVMDTFTGWLPVLFPIPNQGAFDSRWLSFPSGHTAVAVAFAIGLASIYPRGRWLFGLFAFLATFQRIESGAHYVSDTLAGAAIGAAFILLIGESRIVGRWFDRLERSCDRDESVSVLD
jgi:membrane-associated phospholipid phosphatase